jgi:hypothetical protein
MSFFEIFQPGLTHLREERDRRKMLVSKPTHGGGAPLGIDLEAGIATIRIPAKTAPAEPEPDAAEAPGAKDHPDEDAPAGAPD